MAPCSTRGSSMSPCYAVKETGARLMKPKPIYDEFDDLVHPSERTAVCQVRRQAAAIRVQQCSRTAAVRVPHCCLCSSEAGTWTSSNPKLTITHLNLMHTAVDAAVTIPASSCAFKVCLVATSGLLWQLLSTLTALPRQIRAKTWCHMISSKFLTLLCASEMFLYAGSCPGPTDTWQAASELATHTIIIRSRQPTQPSCLPFAKLPSMQHIKARSNRMMASIRQPFAQLQKLCKGRAASQFDVTTRHNSCANFAPEEAITSRPHSGLGNLLCKLTRWSSSASSNSSGSFLQPCSSSRRSSGSQSSRSNSSSLSGTRTGSSSPQSPRESLSNDIIKLSNLKRDSAYEDDNGQPQDQGH